MYSNWFLVFWIFVRHVADILNTADLMYYAIMLD